MAPQLVGDQPPGFTPLTLEQAREEVLCAASITRGLDEDVDHTAVLVDGAPKTLTVTLSGQGVLPAESGVGRVGCGPRVLADTRGRSGRPSPRLGTGGRRAAGAIELTTRGERVTYSLPLGRHAPAVGVLGDAEHVPRRS